MAVTKEVTPSGTVGKQVFTSSEPVILKSVILTAVSAATLVIRDGETSGDVVLDAVGEAGHSGQFIMDGIRFDKGMHVKVTDANNKTYLVIE